MTKSCLKVETYSFTERRAALKAFLNRPHLGRLLGGVGSDLMDERQLPENELIDLDIEGAELTYAGCDTPQKLWDSLSQTNAKDQNNTYGKIMSASIIEDPTLRNSYRFLRFLRSVHSLSPENVLTIASCLKDHFDIEEIFRDFLERNMSKFRIPYSTYCASGPTPVWCWSIKTYGLGSRKAPKFPLIMREDYGKFPTTEDLCLYRSSTIITLSFDQHRDNQEGGPWRVLVLATNKYYRKRTEVSFRESGEKMGYEAFLTIFSRELKDSRRKMRAVFEEIIRITKPKEDILFDETIRDDLLFEDSTFSLSRNYFWALKAMENLNGSIESLLEKWEIYKTFPLLEFCTGRQKENGMSPLMESLPEKLHEAVYLIEEEMEKFREMLTLNGGQRDEIRRQLQEVLSASSAREARTAVMQGRYIRTLTSISTAFLPIMLVTSIFSMSVLPASAGLGTFATVMLAVCIPVYICAFTLASDLSIAKIKDVIAAASRHSEWAKGILIFGPLATGRAIIRWVATSIFYLRSWQNNRRGRKIPLP